MGFRIFKWRELAALCLVVCGFPCVAGERDQLLASMQARPGDPWPKGFGHVVLAWPGSTEEEKGYIEPGGSLSPAFASFGVSIWVADNTGRLVATSETVPLTGIRQRFVFEEEKALPAVETDTAYYTLRWTLTRPGQWQLLLQAKGTNSYPVLVVRSVGPSGAPLQSLFWDGKKLDINQQWQLSLSKSVKDAQIGAEGFSGAGARDPKKKQQLWVSDKGWAYARLPLNGSQLWKATLETTKPVAKPLLGFSSARTSVKVELPEAAFAECLDAQVAHLLMGLVRNETRPGDPNNYPLQWLRDGAYVVAALARAGQMDVARQLCQPMAEHDFFGGFGSEADAPGLALWALGETARVVGDPKFDAWLWPHARRKAELVMSMLTATQAMHRPYIGPIVPAHRDKPDLDLVCDPARDGLIRGRMDWHRPVLYVNAVAYAGLREAARFAAAAGDGGAARQWEETGARLREAWNKALPLGEMADERNFICGLYPTWIVTDRDVYKAQLMASWQAQHEPGGGFKPPVLWTYFGFASAHQLLPLGDVERVWQDLRWFWGHQASPGLYTWWESDHEENTFGLWAERVRGWASPPNVTPHYWSAAEALLLQLDMLAMVDESGPSPVLVIGGGMPAAWMNTPMKVSGVGTRLGEVGWEWKPPVLKVKVKGRQVGVKPGTQFPSGTRLECSFDSK